MTNPQHEASPDIDGLVERLRQIRGTQFTPIENALVTEAADTLLALARQCEGMRKTLGVFADALDEADNIIAVNCGTDTPKEWDRAYKRCAKARATLPDEVGK